MGRVLTIGFLIVVIVYATDSIMQMALSAISGGYTIWDKNVLPSVVATGLEVGLASIALVLIHRGNNGWRLATLTLNSLIVGWFWLSNIAPIVEHGVSYLVFVFGEMPRGLWSFGKTIDFIRVATANCIIVPLAHLLLFEFARRRIAGK